MNGLARPFRQLRRLLLKALDAVGLQDRWWKNLYPGLSGEAIRTRVVEQAEAHRTGRLLCLGYPASYVGKPRWGYTCPLHQELKQLFDRDRVEHQNILRELAVLLPCFLRIRKTFADDGSGEPGWLGGLTNPIDTALLYRFVTKGKPKTYLEIGSGLTTLFAARAKADHHLDTRIVSIDPNPRADVDLKCDEVIRQPLEKCDLRIFEGLEPGDIVFMDGSHVSAVNSDVTVFMLEVVPKLKPGVMVHVHDILLPYDYSELHASRFWNEQYLVGAYLLGARDRVKILMPPPLYAADSTEARDLLRPLTTAGLAEPSEYWYWGGSLWFTHV
jgi:hypothetical protein